MFDNSEGFFGLQVIEGVNVVTQADGRVEFVADIPEASEGSQSNIVDEDETEFEGFDDEPEAEATGNTSPDGDVEEDVQGSRNTKVVDDAQEDSDEGD